jgi:hypothetical protein
MTAQSSKPDRGALSIPSADGYHYADDHPWEAKDQNDLIDVLWRSVEHFRRHEKPSDPAGTV